MKKTLIVRIGEGLGNQLFMYANAYSLSKKFGYSLYVDDESGFSKNKRSRSYNLNFLKKACHIRNPVEKFQNFTRGNKSINLASFALVDSCFSPDGDHINNKGVFKINEKLKSKL